MSIHSSLRRTGGKSGRRRNVLKRHERLQHLINRGLWTGGRSAFGLPKIKQERIKARKAAPKEATSEQAVTPSEQSPSAS